MTFEKMQKQSDPETIERDLLFEAILGRHCADLGLQRIQVTNREQDFG